MHSDQIALQIDNLCYSHRSDWIFKKTEILSDISLTVKAGESFGFLGHNGAGKTTGIKCILDLLRPYSGKISIFGLDSRLVNARKNLAYVPEQPYFYDHLTVKEMLGMYATLAGVSSSNIKKEIKRVLELVKFEKSPNLTMQSLSKGLVQRIAIAQSLLGQPKLLILDEPFSGLDPVGRREIVELLLEQKKQGVTIFISSHVLSDVQFLCDRVSILIKGKLERVIELNSLRDLAKGTFEIGFRIDSIDEFDFESSRIFQDLAALTAKINGKDVKQELSGNSSLDFPLPETRVMKQAGIYTLKFSEREKAEKALTKILDQKLRLEFYNTDHLTLEQLFIELVNNRK